jgi:hypothetical protein
VEPQPGVTTSGAVDLYSASFRPYTKVDFPTLQIRSIGTSTDQAFSVKKPPSTSNDPSTGVACASSACEIRCGLVELPKAAGAACAYASKDPGPPQPCASDDDCVHGTYCAPEALCRPGCKTNADCTTAEAPRCHAGQCTGCVVGDNAICQDLHGPLSVCRGGISGGQCVNASGPSYATHATSPASKKRELAGIIVTCVACAALAVCLGCGVWVEKTRNQRSK